MKFTFSILVAFALSSNLTANSQIVKADGKIYSLDSIVNRATAIKDILSHRMKIFGSGGISPTAYEKADSVFETKYKITYVLFGCEPLYTYNQMKAYNDTIGEFLDQTYGAAWRKELHADVVGLKR